MFRLHNVTYKHILDIPELDIASQRITCIIGESGSGKTTLLKLLNHLISADEGEIWVDGRLVTEWDPVELRRQVVMLPQTPAIFPGTIAENLVIGRKFSEMPPVEKSTLLAVLQKMHLQHALTEKADVLSGGEKQRLALARVLLMDPKVLLLDEPSSALDEETAQMVIGSAVEEYRAKQKTMVMVTHAMPVVRSFADELIEMKQGRIFHIQRRFNAPRHNEPQHDEENRQYKGDKADE